MKKNQKLSDNAKAELAVISKAITEIIDMAVTAVEYDDLETAKKIEPLEETIDQLEYQLKTGILNVSKQGIVLLTEVYISLICFQIWNVLLTIVLMLPSMYLAVTTVKRRLSIMNILIQFIKAIPVNILMQ